MTQLPSAKLTFDLELDRLKLEREVGSLLQENWIPHVNQKDYSGSWSVYPLRALQEHAHSHPILQAFRHHGDNWVDLPILETLPIIRNILSRLQCPINSARLMNLHSGAHIKSHSDGNISLEYGEARLHVPLITSSRVKFLSGGDILPMKFGELWYVNACMLHEVKNSGKQNRVNLVIDCIVNDWLKNLVINSY